MVNATVYPVNNNFHSPRFPAAPGNIILLSVWDFDLSRYLIEVEKAMAPHFSTLTGKSHERRTLVDRSPWGR